MNVVIGIDVGGSTTKIVGYQADGTLIAMGKVEAADPLTSAYGALGKFINENNLALTDVCQIILTGVGASLFTKDVYGIPTRTVNEFEAIGLGGLALSGKKEGLIVSMGTGTALCGPGKTAAYTLAAPAWAAARCWGCAVNCAGLLRSVRWWK